jgi:hypothetical protein
MGGLSEARTLPNGARYFRCALQVNPYSYLVRHNKPTLVTSEADYNQALIDALIVEGVEVIAVTDHYRIKTSEILIETARAAGLFVMPGFEAVTKDGVHFLCIFDPQTPIDRVDRLIGDCGIHDDNVPSPLGRYDSTQLLEECAKWGATCIAAHVAAEQGGLLRKLSGQTRIKAWQHPNLLACSLPGPVDGTPQDLRNILMNRDNEYTRNYPIAVLNSQDVSAPGDVKQPGSSCWIKMSEVTVQGLRQAFLDPESRIRLASELKPDKKYELVAMSWEGGFLDQQAIHFNEDLNVLVGGRGAGKSTVIESIRYVLGLDPLGEDAKKVHGGFTKHVLKSGTKVSLVVRSHTPSRQEYIVERTVPGVATVKDESGTTLAISPRDVIPHMEIYGQHEIAELAKSPEKLTQLLDRFVQIVDISVTKADLKRDLQSSRQSVEGLEEEAAAIADRLTNLPKLEELLKRYQQLGVENRLKEQGFLLKEEVLLTTATNKLAPIRKALTGLKAAQTIDQSFLSDDALSDMPGREILKELRPVLASLQSSVQTVVVQTLDEGLSRAATGIDAVRTKWDIRKTQVTEAVSKILRELQKEKIDGNEFIKLKKDIETLLPLRDETLKVAQRITEAQAARGDLLNRWENAKQAEFKAYEKAARRVSKKLKDKVRVTVTYEGNKEPLFTLLKDDVGGRLIEAIEALRAAGTISLPQLTAAGLMGQDQLVKGFNLPPNQAGRLANAGQEVWRKVEELDLPHTTKVELNVAPDGLPQDWRELDRLSTGQKATAILLLLLLDSDSPLVVDQPEDDLDNRFVTEVVVPKMREEKKRRQFIFATHNANIPVLGDAELIAGLLPAGEADGGRAVIPQDYLGSLESDSVREMIESLLEGGKTAFETRRRKYGF